MGRWIVLLGVVILTGCASSPRPAPELPESSYRPMAESWVKLQRCIEQGHLSPEISALGERYANGEFTDYNYNVGRMNALINAVYRDTPRVHRGHCNSLASAIAGRKQQIDMHNAQVDQNRQALQNQINQINQNRPVICNRVGTYTMCQ